MSAGVASTPTFLEPPNSALEQTASAARPWQGAQRRQCVSSGPRPVPRPPLLTAGVSPARYEIDTRNCHRYASRMTITLSMEDSWQL